MGILKAGRDKLKAYAEDASVINQISAQGQQKFVDDVMADEGVDRETALRWCLGLADPPRYEYSLGYKLADPIWNIGIFKQAGRGARKRAAENFRKKLCPEEAALFDEYCTGHAGGKVRMEMKQEFKKQKKKHKDVDVSEFEQEDEE